MPEIICPHCRSAFTIDEAGYADILKQVRDQEFDDQLKQHLQLAQKDKQNEIELVSQKIRNEMSVMSASKDAAIRDLEATLNARDIAQQLAIAEAVTAAEKQRDLLANELQQVRDNNLTASRLAESKYAKDIQSVTLQKDAELNGFEWEIGSSFGFINGDMTLSAGYDYVRAEFTDGTNIPRIVPARNILTVSYSEENLEARLTYKDVEEQNDIGEGETETEAYEMLDFSLKKTFVLNNQNEISFSLFGKNLLDEVARNHASFVKNEVPLPGRNYGLKLNYKF